MILIWKGEGVGLGNIAKPTGGFLYRTHKVIGTGGLEKGPENLGD